MANTLDCLSWGKGSTPLCTADSIHIQKEYLQQIYFGLIIFAWNQKQERVQIPLYSDKRKAKGFSYIYSYRLVV